MKLLKYLMFPLLFVIASCERIGELDLEPKDLVSGSIIFEPRLIKFN